MEYFDNNKSSKQVDYEDYMSRLNNWSQYAQKRQQEENVNMLTIRHFLSIRFIVETIDFQKLYNSHIEESRITSDLQGTKFHERTSKQNEPTTEFIIMTITSTILDLCKENQFELGLIYGQPHYFNNYYYVEINKPLLWELLSDISKRNGVKNYEDRFFIDELCRSFTNELIQFPRRQKSYKEKGVKRTKLPKRRRTDQGDYHFKNRS